MKVGDHIKVKRGEMGKKRAKRSLSFFGSDHMSGFFLPNFMAVSKIGRKEAWAKKRAKKSVSTERPIVFRLPRPIPWFSHYFV